MRMRSVIALAASGLFAGCASTPDVTIHYFFPKAQTQLQVTQSLACSNPAKGEAPGMLSVVTVTATTVYSSDRVQKQGSFSYQALSGLFSDADITVNLTDDGRLSGLNATSTGEGDAFIKNIAALAVAVKTLKAPTDIHIAAPKTPEACKIINAFSSGGGKPVTLTYGATLSYDPVADGKDDFGKSAPIEPDAGSHTLYALLNHIFPKLAFEVQITQTSLPDTVDSNTSTDTVPLTLNKFAIAKLEVRGPDSGLEKSATVWTSEIPVPLRSHYSVPIPKAAVFGSQSFALSLSGYGSIQKLEYAKKTGAADATEAATALAKSQAPPSAADQAAIVKGQADLIFQQQRLLLCQTSPTECK